MVLNYLFIFPGEHYNMLGSNCKQSSQLMQQRVYFNLKTRRKRDFRRRSSRANYARFEVMGGKIYLLQKNALLTFQLQNINTGALFNFNVRRNLAISATCEPGGYATMARSDRSIKSAILFSIYSMTCPPFGATDIGLTPIGVRPDHVIKGPISEPLVQEM